MKWVKFIGWLLSLPILMFLFGVMILFNTYFEDRDREERLKELNKIYEKRDG